MSLSFKFEVYQNEVKLGETSSFSGFPAPDDVNQQRIDLIKKASDATQVEVKLIKDKSTVS